MKRINKLIEICAILLLCISLTGLVLATPNAASLKACDDGIDNDGDGLIDMDDPGCSSKNDRSELDPYVECDDGIDNDGDGLADSSDSGCTGPTDTDESNCGDGICEAGETQTTCPVDCGYPDSCSDSDGGISEYVFGTVFGYYNNVPYSNDDFCASEGNVYEYYCNGDYKTGANISCGTDYYTAEYCSGDDVYKDFVDYYCASGACSSSSTPVFVETCEYGCTDGECDVPQYSCTDTDGGMSIYVFGTVSGYYNEYYYSNQDFCANDEMVVEFYCDGDYIQAKNVSCGTDYYSEPYCSGSASYRHYTNYYCASGECGSITTVEMIESCKYGCTDGVCDSIPDSCTDTDGGWNLFEKGTASGYLNEVPFSYTDYCNSTKVLVEYYCYESACGNYVFDMSLNATMECYDGAVIYV